MVWERGSRHSRHLQLQLHIEPNSQGPTLPLMNEVAALTCSNLHAAASAKSMLPITDVCCAYPCHTREEATAV